MLLCGAYRGGRGVETGGRLRVYGHYAVMCVTGGEGRYIDSNGLSARLRPGDAVIVFPEQAHWYGPGRGRTWDEIYATFDGPVFDLWRATGILDPARPVHSLGGLWRERVAALAARIEAFAGPLTPTGRLRAMHALLDWLAETVAADPGPAECKPADWLSQARTLLGTDLARDRSPREVAAILGMGYESFRKRFQQAEGISPARYRAQRRIETASQLLRYAPQMTNRQAAQALGFSDEYHFSRRFAALAGVPPRAFRRRPE